MERLAPDISGVTEVLPGSPAFPWQRGSGVPGAFDVAAEKSASPDSSGRDKRVKMTNFLKLEGKNIVHYEIRNYISLLLREKVATAANLRYL